MKLSQEVLYAIMNAHELASNGRPVVIRVTDWSRYEEGKSNNAGGYLYWEDYEYCELDDMWYRWFGSSCDIGHTCPACGDLLNDSETHWDEESQRYICEDVSSFFTGELVEILTNCVSEYSGSRDDISIECKI